MSAGEGAPARRERGFALLIVLWTVALLAMLGTQITAAGRGEAQLARNIRNAAVAEAAADGGIALAVFHALDSGPGHWPPDGATRRIPVPGAEVEVRILNEAGKINLNIAQPELLAALMRVLGTDSQTAQGIATAIVDWRFADAGNGRAKAEAYRSAGRSYGPPGAPFKTLRELGLVLGMTPGLLARLTPHLTVFHEGPPNLGAAGPVVRDALRLAAEGRLPEGSTGVEEGVIAIQSSAIGPGGSRATRAAIVRLGQTADGSLFQVLTWDAP